MPTGDKCGGSCAGYAQGGAKSLKNNYFFQHLFATGSGCPGPRMGLKAKPLTNQVHFLTLRVTGVSFPNNHPDRASRSERRRIREAPGLTCVSGSRESPQKLKGSSKKGLSKKRAFEEGPFRSTRFVKRDATGCASLIQKQIACQLCSNRTAGSSNRG